ncbi:MAG: hypothetical protein HN576_13860 [Bacteriovoracaceae bacterium]|nr:hypothetical protein [Bacteriovoracaceae bacterium]
MNNQIYILTFFVILLIKNIVFADNNNIQNAKERWTTLNSLILKEEKAIKQRGSLGPKLQYRLLELKSEKIRLMIEKENEQFLNAKKRNHPKSWYFKKSKKVFNTVKRMGLKIISKYPKFNKTARIYYTLALNERDYGDDKDTEYYLKLSLKHAQKHDKIIHNAKASLAEYYYNNKNYILAVKYYNDVIKNKEDDWYTRHLFNQAWCLLKINQMDKALNNLEISFKESSNPRYISMREQILESFVVFFVHGKKIREGIIFYKDNVIDPTDYLISMAKKTAHKGLFKDTKAVLSKALDNAKALKRTKKVIEIRLNELDIYRNFKKFKLYFKTAVELNILSFKKEMTAIQRSEAVNKISSLVGYLQIRLTGNLKLNNKSYEDKKLEKIISYFKILANLDKINKEKYYYYIGETFYSVKKYKESATAYTEAINISINKRSIRDPSTLQEKIFKSFLSLIGSTGFDKKLNLKNTIFVYENHIQIWPVNRTSKKIYGRLFNLYIEKKEIQKALVVFNKYKKHYKNEKTHQKALYTRIMDHYISIKDSENLSECITKLQKGYLNFNKSYLEKSIAILGSLLFNKYQSLDLNGNKVMAIEGYQNLFQDKRYPNKIHAQSAYNAALIYLDLADTKNAYKWINRSLIKHSPKDKQYLIPRLSIIVKELALLQDFKRSALLASKLLNDFCSINYNEKNMLYNLTVHHQLVDNNYHAALINFKRGKKCQLSQNVIIQNGENIIQFLKEQRLYKSFFKFYNSIEKSSYFNFLAKSVLTSMIDIYWDTQNTNQIKLGKKVKKQLIRLSNKKGISREQYQMINDIKNFDKFLIYSNSISFEFKGNKKRFHEKEFNLSLEDNLKKLQNLSIEAEKLILKGHKELILGTYIVLNNKYYELMDKISNITPAFFNEDFKKGFRIAMTSLINNLETKAHAYRINAKAIIYRNDILSFKNFTFLKDHNFIKKIKYKYLASKLISTADTEGVLK